MLKKGYIVRPFPNGVRITIGTEQENEELKSIVQKSSQTNNRKIGSEKMSGKKRVLLIGVGLIGGSVALAIKKEHDVDIIGYDIKLENCQAGNEVKYY